MKKLIKFLTPYIVFISALLGLITVIITNNRPQTIYVKQEIILGEKEFKSVQEVSTFEQQKSGIPKQETTK